ncbi:MAG: glycine--tRNA ligase subunit beta [Pseudomonadales bacterium]|nr:glycine--tRNA ligase subunit beta [Pseudomonadales bacterium]MCP5330186.1 glycine--tRNA ligase subunit beta [Pseudomonadales bacterium]MCP5344431.1 glycine--tRNA ligase subunit beta [Pseudomonadales bacterium]
MAKKDFLVEIGTGELPPKALRQLSDAFAANIRTALESAGLTFAQVQAFASPRRLAVRVTELDTKQQDKAVERLGPAVAAAFDKEGKPTPAASGFARSCGVDVSALEQSDRDGVLKLAHRSVSKGNDTAALLPNMVSRALATLPIPKKMRWGSARDEFVRPVHWVVMLFGADVLPASILGISSGNTSRGHRFMSSGEILIDSPAGYEKALEKAFVLVDYDLRKERIRSLVGEQADALKATVIIEDDLLEEVTALVEWPVALTGRFDEHFLSVPKEALISSLKAHQKCFYLLDGEGQMLPNFITVSNLLSNDPAQVIAGNERVIRPRLSDAKFFFDTDRKQTLASRQEQLKNIIFQQALGTVYDKSQRVANLCADIARGLNAPVDWCQRAAALSKCDLVTNLVSEFAELQGIAGYYYAAHDGEPGDVAQALNEQYMPRFSGDQLPTTQTGCVLALADKLDTIVGLFAIGQPPTGSKDPFALRRAALGVLRIIVEKALDLDLLQTIRSACANYSKLDLPEGLEQQVFDFMLERFRAWYQAEGISAEVFLSVYHLKPGKPLDFHLRVQAVHRFSQLPEAQSLASANKRVSNILQKEDAGSFGASDASLFTESAERTLADTLAQCRNIAEPLFLQRDYTKGLETLAGSKQSIDDFFDQVLVMDENPALRRNRINLLNELRTLFLQVADISYLHNA